MMEAILAAPGIIGARQAGAGFGGCMVAFVEAGSVPAFAASVRRLYFAAARTQPEVYPVEAAAGAGLLAQEPSGSRAFDRPTTTRAGNVGTLTPSVSAQPAE